MADSKRLKILKALTSHLEGTPGYNLTGKVWRGRRYPGDESELPFLVLFELPPEEQNQKGFDYQHSVWDIGLQGYIRPDPVHLTDPAHDLMAAVKTQLAKLTDFGSGGSVGADFMFSGMVSDFEFDGGLVFAPDETTDSCFFVIKLTINLVESLRDFYE